MIESIAPTPSSKLAPPVVDGPGKSRGIGAAASEIAGVDFASMLGQLAQNASSTLKAAEAASVAGVRGQASAQQVVEAVMQAEQTLHTAIAVRDKVVAAYLEISRMQI
jgi:flagellar hook-basal body complex protein FliE